MGMRSFSFGLFNGSTEVPEEVLGLFSGLVLDPSKKVEFASEIVTAGMQGRINFDQEFNIDAYEAAIRRNSRLNVEGEVRRKAALDFDNDGDERDSNGNGKVVWADYAATHVTSAEQLKDAYEELLDEDELHYAISTIQELQPIILVEEEVDLLEVLKKALHFVPDAVERVRSLCSSCPVVAEQIKVILSSGRSFEELFPVTP